MIQKTDPNLDNSLYYFDQPNAQYMKGFGFSKKELWLGLQNIQSLNAKGNTILRIEATMNNGTNFWIEYDNFRLSQMEYDNYSYFEAMEFWSKKENINWYSGEIDRSKLRIRNKYETFPVLSVGNQVSSISGTFFFLIPPGYLLTSNERSFVAPESFIDAYQYRYYAGFHTRDSDDFECPLKAKSGWWFSQYENLNKTTNCEVYSNLNGFVSREEESVGRFIAFCRGTNEECFTRDTYLRTRDTLEEEVNGKIRQLKLHSTKMFLARSENKMDISSGEGNCFRINVTK